MTAAPLSFPQSSSDRTAIPDSSVRLERAVSLSGKRSGAATRTSARIVVPVWGERYLDDLLSLTIPALLAPGNLPALDDAFECELVIVTERRFFDAVTASPAIARARGYGSVRLAPIDDLLSPWYGITLTYALVRGFADLGPAMVDTHLIFLNADFLLADGSYRALRDRILRGERLVVAPSYCMTLEETVGPLRERISADGNLAMPPREMAEMIIAHRHNTLRAKTVNQALFRTQRYDQFYWQLDDNTLLGRQMPISVVYMRPERAITELDTFWDYGVISEYCPGTTPCVLGDSDDFLMAELRSGATSRELLHLGHPTVEEIARDLTSFTTKDQRDYGRYPLTLHAADRPPNLSDGEAMLAAFVDRVYEHLGKAVNHREHPFWVANFPRFRLLQQEQHKRISAGIPATRQSTTPSHGATSHLTRMRTKTLEWLMRRYHGSFGTLPNTTPWHPLHATLQRVMAAIPDEKRGSNVLIVSSGGLLTAPLSRHFFGRTLTISPEMALTDLYSALRSGSEKFDFCFCDLALADALEFGRVLEVIKPALKEGSKVVVFHLVKPGMNLDHYTYELTRNFFPRNGRATVHYTGSIPAAVASRVFMKSAERYDVGKLHSQIKVAFFLGVSAPFARIASHIEKRRQPHRYPRHCTSMTLELFLD